MAARGVEPRSLGELTHDSKHENSNSRDDDDPDEKYQQCNRKEDLSTGKARNRFTADRAILADRIVRVHDRQYILAAGRAEDQMFASD